MLRHCLVLAAIGLAASSSTSDIASMEFTITVAGMHSTNFGSDYVKTITLNHETGNVKYQQIPHGETTIAVAAKNSGSTTIYSGSKTQTTSLGVTSSITILMTDLFPPAGQTAGDDCNLLTSFSISPMRLKIGRETAIDYETSEGTYDATLTSSDLSANSLATIAACSGEASDICLTPAAGETRGAATLSLLADADAACATVSKADISTVVVQSTADVSATVDFGALFISQESPSKYRINDANAGAITNTLTMSGTCSGTDTSVKATTVCDSGTVAESTVTCADAATTVAMTHPFPSGTPNANNGKCTVTYTPQYKGSDLGTTSTLVYYFGTGSPAEAYAPEVDFAFVSKTEGIVDGTSLTLMAHFSSYDSVNAPVAIEWDCANRGQGQIRFVDANSNTQTGTVTGTGNPDSIAYIVVDESDDLTTCTATGTTYSLSTVQTFDFNTPSPTYSPTPAPCVAPDTCSTHAISETSSGQHLYPTTAFDFHDLPPGSVIAIHTQDAAIWQSSLSVNTQHAIDNCAEIEARVDSVTTDGNGNIYHVAIKELYYDGSWHNTSSFFDDANGLSSTQFRVLSMPLVSTGYAGEIQDCDNGYAVLMRELILQHHGVDLNMSPTTCESEQGLNVRYAVADMSATCHVGFRAVNDDPCDETTPLALVCGTSCQEVGGKYLKALSDGSVEVHSEDTCSSGATGTLSETGDLDTLASTSSLISDFNQYASKLY